MGGQTTSGVGVGVRRSCCSDSEVAHAGIVGANNILQLWADRVPLDPNDAFVVGIEVESALCDKCTN